MHNFDYTPPFLFSNGHVQTIFPVIFRRVNSVIYKRERITTFDDDFLDLDWSEKGNPRLAVISHGLEGSTDRAYVKGMVKAVNNSGWDALAWNYRSCSGEPNRTLRMYHNGVTDDLAWVIRHAKQTGRYREIALIGFSLGGNLTLLHLGKDEPDPIVKKAVVFSVPCDLVKSADILARASNKIYMKRFLVLLHEKVKAKMELFPGLINDNGFNKIKDFKAFDDRYTAPIHGFRDALDYWEKCSSKPYIPDITVPTLIVNSTDDPFLHESCIPFEEADKNDFVTLCATKAGGHVGFISFNRDNIYWSEQTAAEFLNRSCTV